MIKFLILIILISFLGSYAGSKDTSKFIRKIGIPFVVFLFSIFTYNSFWCLLLLLMFVPFSQGYGIPDYDDKGSSLGKIWYEYFSLCTYRTFLANIFTRGTIAFELSLILSTLVFLNNKYLLYLVSTVIFVFSFAYFSWQDYNSIKIFNKEICISDIISYFLLGLYIGILLWI